ncbi:MAG: carboxypeptidase-like regulatory domain-containing protein [Flavobacterium sp.]|uniref:carboxypeptidase-like regulatory domain-containing protein n=1 Tax=Flavobacterium sp. TaxID=239 RepID=UPI0022C6A79B|nr:carboxypeptidase-like regulatory domain-containing protein [Flavobacterium sp.]MCZ8091346.1 carboxypeptidase-like regulatory domain-containing protein [Flavobacterium sp.]MCZ8332251.1 carboxypeptidase-like regulatory domain-containing protein [Flavobacterium sp.]
MIRTFFLFLYIFSSNNLFSQNIIKGVIKDNINQTIISASVILKDNTGKIITYTYTDDLGKYSLKTEKKGQFNLIASSMGFEQKSIDLTFESENETKTIDFVLTPKVTELKEIILETKRPITIKNDTIVFNAKSFLQGNEQTVEDLLKKIPGLNIDANGTIKVGNQEIEKVMIDGDDMFEKGYKILTKNMPVNPIENVEVYQNYSNNKHLKGIENSNKVALNLTLKEDAKRVWFGNMQAGYGLVSENRYEYRANLMNFGKKNKYYFLTNLNNTGENATGDINHLIRPYRFDEPASIGDDQSVNSLLGLGFDTPNLKQKRTNLNNAEMLSLNSIFTLSEKVKLKTLGFLNTDEIDFFRNSLQSFSIGNATFTNTEDFEGRKKQLTGFGKLDLTYDISKTKTYEYTGKFNKTNEKNRSDLIFNNDLLNERLNANNQLFDQKLVYTNRFKDKKVFLLSSRYINEKTPQNYTVNQFIFQDLFSENANNTRQFSENKMQFAGVEAHLLVNKKNGDLLEIKIGNQLRIDELNTRFELLQNENNLAFPNGYQNNLTYTTNDLYLSAKYRFKLKNFTFLTQADAHQLFNQLENFNTKTNQNPFFIMPKIGLDWKINEKNKILTSYSYNTTNAGVLDVYSGFVQTGFRSFSKGLEEFNQLNSSSAILNYTYGSWGDKFFANTFILYSKNNDFFSTNSIIAQNFSQSEKIIIKDREFLSISSSIDRYFKPIKSNLKINLGATKTNFKNIVNNSNLREVKNFNADFGFELRSGFRGFFNYHIGSKWNYNKVETTIKNSFTDNMSFLDLSFMFSDKFNIQVQSERYFFGNLDKNNNKFYFLDLEARYVVKENKLTFFLSGNNLFNTETFRNYSISDINISQTEYRLMPRYVLLKMEYRF